MLITLAELETLKSRGVQAVIADWPLDSLKPLDESPDFKVLLKNAKDTDINVIMGIQPGDSSLYFTDSEAKADAYVNYYIWQNHAKGNSTEPPNNWVSSDRLIFFEIGLIRILI